MILVGKKKFKSKDGKINYCQLYAMGECNSYDLRYSLDVQGNMPETIWVTETLYDKINVKDFGKNISLITEFVNGRNNVIDIKVE